MKTTATSINTDVENLRANVSRLLGPIKPYALARHLGLDCSTVLRWKNGSRKVDSGYLPSLARYLKVSVDDLYAPIDET